MSGGDRSGWRDRGRLFVDGQVYLPMGVSPGLLATPRFHLFLRKQASMAMFAWLRRRRRDAIRRRPFPAEWRAFIEKNVPYVACLSAEDREELVGHI